jgi:hypothetical protein
MKPEYPSSIIHHPSSIIHLRILNIILILALVISIADPARAGSSQATGASFAWQAVDLAGMGAEYRQYLGQTWRAITQWLGDLLPEEDPTILTLRSETEIANPGDVVRIYWEMSGPDIPKTIDLTLHLPRAFEVYDGMVEAEANPTPSVTPTEEPTAAPTDAIPPRQQKPCTKPLPQKRPLRHQKPQQWKPSPPPQQQHRSQPQPWQRHSPHPQRSELPRLENHGAVKHWDSRY